MKKKYTEFGAKRVKTYIYDEIVKEAKARIGHVSSDAECPKKLSDREKVRLHTRNAQRWAMLVEIFGLAGAIFFDWIPKNVISRFGDPEFKSVLIKCKQKRTWVHQKTSQYFDCKTLNLLCSSGSGKFVNIPILLTSLESAPELDLHSMMEGLQLNEHNIQAQDDNLQGIPWDNFSCSLDALLSMNICIAEVLGEDWYRGRENVGSNVLKQVSEDILALVKIPWSDRKADVMQHFRDNIREYLSSDRLGIEERVIIGRMSALEDSDRHIIPFWLIEFPIFMNISCSSCQSLKIVEKRTLARGLVFCVRNEHLTGMKDLQDILEFIVHFPLHRLLMGRWMGVMNWIHERWPAMSAM